MALSSLLLNFNSFVSRIVSNTSKFAPYHPSSNGLAERAVQVFKRSFRKEKAGTIEERLARMLMKYRTTPHSTTGVSSSELLFSWKIKTRLDLIKPSLETKVYKKQQNQKIHHDKTTRECQFKEGESVFVRNHRGGEKWLSGHIELVTGPVSFQVKLADGRTVRSHQDHIRKRGIEQETHEDTTESEEYEWSQESPIAMSEESRDD